MVVTPSDADPDAQAQYSAQKVRATSGSVGADTAADDVSTGTGTTRAPEPYVLQPADGPLTADQLRAVDAWWRAANYLAVGQIYLMANPLLRESLRPDHVKPRLLGHWGTTPGLNFLYTHLNRAIRERDLDAIFVCGPGHGGPAVVAQAYLEGSYTELYPHVTRDIEGLRRLFRPFLF